MGWFNGPVTILGRMPGDEGGFFCSILLRTFRHPMPTEVYRNASERNELNSQ